MSPPPDPVPSPPTAEKTPADTEKSSVENAAGELMLEYKEGRWSPLNPEGKKQYDRDFLLQLQFKPMCTIKPKKMPHLDIVKDKCYHPLRNNGTQKSSKQSKKTRTKPKKTASSTNQAVKAGEPEKPDRKQEISVEDNSETQCHCLPGNNGPQQSSKQSKKTRKKSKKLASASSSPNQALKDDESEKPDSKQEIATEDNLQTQANASQKSTAEPSVIGPLMTAVHEDISHTLTLKGPKHSDEEMKEKTKPQVDEFLHNADCEKLEFTMTPTKISPLAAELSPEELRKELSSMLQNNKNNNEIFDWIDANVSQKTASEPAFIRALVTAVHEHAIHGSGPHGELVLAQTQLKERIPLLKRYIEHKENLELQALYAIQSLMNQLGHPKLILRQIFDLLYDEDVIPDEIFLRWEQSSDPDEMEGKGWTLLSVSSFFAWLREAESGESDSP